jgi:hypothetical protein
MFRRRLLSWLGLEPGEAPTVLRLAVPYFFLGLAISFFETAAFAIFLAEFTAQNLPTIYILNAVVIIAVTLLFLRLSGHSSLSRRIAANLCFLVGLCLLFWLGVRAGPGLSPLAVVFLLPVGSETLKTLIKTGYWGAAIRVFDLRQGKRLFGLLGTGRWIAFMVAGLLTPLIVGRFGVESLLLLAGLAVAAALPLMLLIPRHFGARIADQPVTARPPGSTAQWRTLSAYTWLIFGLIFIWFIASFFVDNIFYDRTTYRFPNETELATFLGVFSFVRGALTLVVTLFISRAVTRRFGLRVAVLLLPALILLLSLLMLVAAGLTQDNGVLPAAGAVFVLAVLLKLIDKAIGDTDEQATLSVLYQPLHIAERDRAQTLGTGVVKPLAIGVAGLALLDLNAVGGITGFALTYVLVPLAAIWLVVAIVAGRRYLAAVSDAVTRRRLSGLVPDLADAAGIRVLRSLLSSPQPQRALYALRVLAELDAYEHLQATAQAMRHPTAAVRTEALAQATAVTARLDAAGSDELITATRYMAAGDLDPNARGRALLTLALIHPTAETAALIQESLGHQPDDSRTGALAALLVVAVGHPELVPESRARAHLDAATVPGATALLDAVALTPPPLWQSGSPLTDWVTARIAGSLATAEPGERVAALRAAATVRQHDLWPLVIPLLGDAPYSVAASNAIEAGGPSTLPALAAAWHSSLPVKIQTRLAKVIGRIGGSAAHELLAARLDSADPAVRTQILRVLSRAGYPVPIAQANRLLHQEAEDAAWSLAALVDLQALQPHSADSVAFLAEPLESYLVATQTRILYLLALMYDRRVVLEGQRAFDQARRLGGRPEARERLAYALESLDLLLDSDHKRLVFPVLENTNPSRARDELRAWFPELCRPMPPEERLALITRQSGPRGHGWLRATAIYIAAQTGLTSLRSDIMPCTEDADQVVRETAEWALARMDGTASSTGKLLTVEKTLLMKRVSLFSEVQNAVLAEQARTIEEIDLPPGATLFQTGDSEDSTYIIVDGHVRIHRDGQTLNHLGPLTVFGEMATLTGEPRTASATTQTATRLLRLDRQFLDELIEENPHVGISIVHVVAGYLRTNVAELLRLRSAHAANTPPTPG